MRKAVRYSITASMALVWVLAAGHLGNDIAFGQDEPPLLKRIGPSTITAGSPTFTLRLEGKRFAGQARAVLDGVPLDSSRVVSKKGKVMLAEIDASVVAGTGTHTVHVQNPDGAVTASIELKVVDRDPDLSIRLEGNAAEEASGFLLQTEITGEGFDENSKVLVSGFDVADTQFLSDSLLRFSIPSKFTSDAARLAIIVRNKGGALSNTDIVFVVPAPATLRSVNPDSIEVGSDDFEIEVRGEFKPDARILVNGTALQTESPRDGRLKATVPGAFRSAPGQLIVRVEQAGIQSADATIVVAPETGPFIFSVSPSRIRLGENKTVIELIGANFTGRSQVLVDGEEVKIRDSVRTRLTVVVKGDVLANPGSHSVQVIDRDENPSNVTSFEIVPDVEVSTVAGDKLDGFNRETCVSLEDTRFRRPSRATLGPDGLLYVVDHQNHAIRTVDFAANEVCTLVGTGIPGYSDSGNAAGFEPTFAYPLGIAMDSDGTIFVSENGNNVIRRVRRAADGTVTLDTFAGAATEITDKDRQKRLNSTRKGLTGFRNGDQATAEFRQPDDMVIASDGTIYVADAGNHAIRKIVRANGQVSVETVAGNGVPGFADGEAANARFNTPTSLALSDDESALFVADTNNARIRRIDLLAGRVGTLAGSGRTGATDGPPGLATFDRPTGLALDVGGVLFVSEFGGGRIRRVEPSGDVSTVAGGDGKFKDGPGIDATFSNPRDLLVDRVQRILYVADFENFRIRRIELQ